MLFFVLAADADSTAGEFVQIFDAVEAALDKGVDVAVFDGVAAFVYGDGCAVGDARPHAVAFKGAAEDVFYLYAQAAQGGFAERQAEVVVIAALFATCAADKGKVFKKRGEGVVFLGQGVVA